MKILNIKKSSFENSGYRLDAKPYLSSGNIVLNKLKNCKYELANVFDYSDDIFYGGRDKRYYVSNYENGIPFMGSSDMLKNDLFDLKLISKKLTKNLSNYLLDSGWILISRSGTIGNTTFTNELFKGKAASEHIIRVKPKKNVFSGYLYAYLSSKFGYNLLTQGSFGAVIQHIEPDFVGNIPVPLLPEAKQEKIHKLIIEGAELRVEANKYLKEAIDYFNHKYAVNGITKIFNKKVSTLNFSWAAYNNNIECDKMYLENTGDEFVSLNLIVKDCFSPPMFKHIYLDKDNGHPFLTGAELTKFNKRFYRWLSKRGVKDINDYKVKKGTLLLYKSGNTDGGILGNVFITDDILEGACLSDHVIRIFTDDLSISYWLYAFFKSEAGIRLLQKTATGSMIPFITTDRLMNLLVPKPNENFENISRLIGKYLELNVQSQLKENQAIDLIEKEIDTWQ